jgi:hypothetical protein
LEVLVTASVRAEEMPPPVVLISDSRLATHTTVHSGMLLYHIPRYNLAGVELDGQKKPKAKLPSLETMTSPGLSGC